MSQQYRYPSSSSVTVAAVGANGAPIPSQSILIAGENPSGDLTQLQVDVSGSLLVSASSLPLPAGAATEATLAAMSAKLPATLGQKAMAASMAVVVASDQTALHVIVDSSALPSGASTAALQTSGNASLTSIDGKFGSLGQKAMAGSAPVVLASDQAAIPVTVASLPLPTGAATSAKQDTGNTSLASIDGKTPALGQAAMAASSPVVIASNQSTLPVSAASLPLPSGAATSANQATEIASLSAIDTKLGGTLKVQAPSVEDSSFTDNPFAIAGKGSTGPGTFIKQSVSTATGGTDGDGNQILCLAVRDFSQGSPSAASGSLTAGSPTASFSCTNPQSLVVSISGTWTGSITANNMDSGSPVALQMRSMGTATLVSAITANGVYMIYGGGLENLRLDGAGLTGTSNYYIFSQYALTDVYAHISGVVPLPTGAATETTLAAQSAKLPATLGQKTMANSMAVVIASDQSALPVAAANGMAKINQAYNDYSSVNVTTVAYVQLIASTSAAAKVIEIFDSSGQAMILAVGAAASEVDQFYIFPGGQGAVQLAIPASSRVSIKAKTANATSGYILVNTYG